MKISFWLKPTALLLATALMAGTAALADNSTVADSAAVAIISPASPASLLQALVDGDFETRAAAIHKLAEHSNPKNLELLTALLDGRLQYTADTPAQIVIVAATGEDPVVSSALDGKSLGPASALTLDTIPINNSLRGELRNIIAGLQLSSPNTADRLSAAKRLINDVTPEVAAQVASRLPQEEDAEVRAILETVVALGQLGSEEAKLRQQAAAGLAGSLYPEVATRLQDIASNDADPAVQAAAKASLAEIKNKTDFYRVAENVFFGLSLGSVLLLAAVGLAITFGVMGVINMAHGELIMLGAYTAYVMQQLLPNHIALALLLSIPAAFMVSGLVGIIIERGVIRFLYGRPLETLLATFGLSLVLQQAVRSVFSPLNRAVASPEFMSGSLEINPAWAITYNRLYILIFSLIVFFLLMALLKRTTLGLKLRAVSQNRAMARAVGVRADWVDALTFGLGAGIAGVAGVALSQLTNVGPNLGQAYIIDSFMVVVFGGVGNLWGTLVGALGLGVANKFLEPYAGSVLAKILVLVFIILFIQKRPRGLFPQKGRAAEA